MGIFRQKKNNIKNIAFGLEKVGEKYLRTRYIFGNNSVKYFRKEAINKYKVPYKITRNNKLITTESKKNICIRQVGQITGKKLKSLINMVSKSRPLLPLLLASGGFMRLTEFNLIPKNTFDTTHSVVDLNYTNKEKKNTLHFLDKSLIKKTQNEKQSEPISNYKLIRFIGDGGYAKVHHAFDIKYKREVAIKVLNQPIKQTQVDSLEREFKIANLLSHENIIKVFDFQRDSVLTEKNIGKTSKFNFTAMELVTNSDQFEYVNQERFTERTARYFFRQFIKGLKHCHDNGVYHGDLRLENTCLNNKFQVKIIDFGKAVKLNDQSADGYFHIEKDYKGSDYYLGPEIRSRKYKGAPFDIYAAGVMLFTMVMGDYPFYEFDDKWYNYLTRGPDEFWHLRIQECDNDVSQKFTNLINSMLRADPEERIKIYGEDGILNDPWFINNDVPTDQDIMLEFSLRRDKMKGVDGLVTEKDQQKI